MTPTKNRILVHFHEEIDTPLNLTIPERYVIHTQQSADDNETRMGVTTDRRLINPQTVDVLTGEYAGEQAFVYYGAYETAKWVDDNAIIDESMLLFLLNPVRMLNKNRICEEIFIEDTKTKAGIILELGVAESVRVRDVQTGDAIITTDAAQYKFRLNGQRYILVRDKYIAGINDLPYGDNLLIEYIPDINPKRDARNEEKRRQKDFMDSHRMYYEAKDFAPEPMPRYVSATVLHGKYEGCEVIVERNHGVCVAKNRAIIPPDNLVAIKDAVA